MQNELHQSIRDLLKSRNAVLLAHNYMRDEVQEIADITGDSLGLSQEAAKTATGHGMQEVEVRVQGPGAGRESAIRAIQASGLNISAIRDVTPVPHNGCRAPKKRRV